MAGSYRWLCRSRLARSCVRMREAAGLRGAPPIPEAQYDRKIQDCLGILFRDGNEELQSIGWPDEHADAAEVRALMRLCRK